MMKTTNAIAVATAIAFGGLAGAQALLGRNPANVANAVASIPRPVWTEVKWPFLIDQWGKGKAFQCAAAHCGREVNLYLRAKIGFCNCTTGVADDEELERLSDFHFLGDELLPLGAGRPIAVASMKGRSRTYKLMARNRPGETAISIAFNEGCDAIVATIVLPHDQPSAIEPSVIDFLNSRTVVNWASAVLGL